MTKRFDNRELTTYQWALWNAGVREVNPFNFIVVLENHMSATTDWELRTMPTGEFRLLCEDFVLHATELMETGIEKARAIREAERLMTGG